MRASAASAGPFAVSIDMNDPHRGVAAANASARWSAELWLEIARGGADRGMGARDGASDARKRCRDVCCSCDQKRDTARGPLGDRKGLGASTDAEVVQRGFGRWARNASVSIHGDAKSQQCVAACATAASILDRTPSGGNHRTASGAQRRDGAQRGCLQGKAFRRTGRRRAVHVVQDGGASSNHPIPRAVALPQVPPFLRFFDPDLPVGASASAHLPVPHGLES